MNDIPKGFKLVPVEPTVAMEDSAAPECGGYCPRCDDDMQIKTGMQVDIYRAMLDAAPTPPQPIYDEAAELSKFMDHMQDKTLYVPGFKDRDDTKMQFSDDVTDTLWMGWLACAQSRAKAGEDE
ncbi:hypothetical protein [Pseudomonas marginalis]|uniref:hypothetical protein n=1 Tax=Pseudomonas marginalis TaxID=298 RepID=UPI0011B7B564|nr:hypothetical protein [Pseudomonas marginalis]KAA8555180.1 hypothetical protein FX984_01798 [Pseudomonas marginalis]TWR71927.1 hypothetical protein FIV40_09500 [Pseudomonas marginalis]